MEETWNTQTILAVALFGFITLCILYIVLEMIFYVVVVRTITSRKHPQFRIIEHVRENTLNPPGTRNHYTIEGKTIYGFWLNPHCCWCEPQRYETIDDARRAKEEFEYNTNNKWVDSEDFKDVVSEINRNGKRVKITEKKECGYGHYISDTEDPKYQFVIVRHRFDNIDKENPTDVTFFKKYRLYKKRLWWWHKVSYGSFNEIDELARELNTKKEYRQIVN